MIIDDIASEFQNQLGVKYKVHANTNAVDFLNIDSSMTSEKQIANQDLLIHCILTKTPGEIVALKELITSSFSWNLSFYAPVEVDVFPDIDTLINAMNGVLHDLGTYRYFMTFNEPFATGNVENDNGVMYQIINLSGSIAVSDKSLFGNDYTLYIDGNEVKGLLTANLEITAKSEPKSLESSMIPQYTVDYYDSTMSLSIHCKKDDTLVQTFLNYVLDATTLENNGDIKNFLLKFTRTGVADKTWIAKLLSASCPFTLGGYMILSLTFTRTVS